MNVRMYLLLLTALFAGCSNAADPQVWLPGSSGVGSPGDPSGQPAPVVNWDQRAKPHFDWAQRQILLHTSNCLVPLDELFAQGRKGTPGFAEDALGWSSKWRLMVDCVPYTRHDRHAGASRAERRAGQAGPAA